MAKTSTVVTTILHDENIISKIYFLRGQKVMLDKDLAEIYGIETKRMKEAVRRNAERFPPDFMFEITREEYSSLRTQFATLENTGQGKHSKYLPFAFTEQGVAMLSGIINSPKAIAMNIAIMRAFVQIRKVILENSKIAEQLNKLETRLGEHDAQLNGIYEAIENLLDDKVDKQTATKRKRIGFRPDE
jgi:hypothetical protein